MLMGVSLMIISDIPRMKLKILFCEIEIFFVWKFTLSNGVFVTCANDHGVDVNTGVTIDPTPTPVGPNPLSDADESEKFWEKRQ